MPNTLAFHGADLSLRGKLRRRAASLFKRRPVAQAFDRPTLSLCFDDIPATAATLGGPLVVAAGGRASFYVCADLIGLPGPMGDYASEAEVQALARAGHEIGCHTFEHLNCALASQEQIRQSLLRNAEAFARLRLPMARSFAFPFGDVSHRAKDVLEPHFRALRGVQAGVARPGADLFQLPSVGLEGPHGEAAVLRALEQVAKHPAWLIVHTHDVRSEPSPYGCTPEGLAFVLHSANRLGFDIRPLGDVAAGLDEAQAAA